MWIAQQIQRPHLSELGEVEDQQHWIDYMAAVEIAGRACAETFRRRAAILYWDVRLMTGREALQCMVADALTYPTLDDPDRSFFDHTGALCER